MCKENLFEIVNKKQISKILCSNFNKNVVVCPSEMTVLDIGPKIWEQIQANMFRVVFTNPFSELSFVFFPQKFPPENQEIALGRVYTLQVVASKIRQNP